MPEPASHPTPRLGRHALSAGLLLALLLTMAPVPFQIGAPLPAADPGSGVVWLGDFEGDPAAPSWSCRDCSLELDPRHASHGRLAARVRFRSARAPALRLAFAASDWRPYAQLVFDVASDDSRQQRLLVRLEDARGNRYQEEIYLQRPEQERVAIALAAIPGDFDLSAVTELRFYLWQPGRERTLSIDGVALLREAAAARAVRPEPRPAGVVPDAVWKAGWVSSLTRLEPDPSRLAELNTGTMRLTLARGERESVQVVVVGAHARSVRVSLAPGPLRELKGEASIDAARISVRRVDWVRTSVPDYPVARVGEWSDPLPLASSAEVDPGRVQPFWITLHAARSQPAGTYRGRLELSGSDGQRRELAIEVKVRDFELPERPRLDTAFELNRHRLARAYRQFVPGGKAWQGRLDELASRYHEDMLGNRISPLLNVDPTQPAFTRKLAALDDRGLGVFAVGRHGGNAGNDWPDDPRALEQGMAWYQRAESALASQKLLDRAYVYGWDEPVPGDPRVATVFAALGRAAPRLRRLLVMLEAPDPVLHRSWLEAVDLLCIRVTAWDAVLAEAYRAEGKELWLYVASPGLPYPSLVVDYPALSYRILPWMCRRLGARGLLYWSVNHWRSDPWRGSLNYVRGQNLNGSLYYPGPEGPVPSLRLEILRDGLEDYDYLDLLAERVIAARAAGLGGEAAVESAAALVEVPDSIVASPREWARDADLLLAQRERIAAAIERLDELRARRAR